ncbi:MAG: hypothetical protein R3F43_15380 [bacterium]
MDIPHPSVPGSSARPASSRCPGTRCPGLSPAVVINNPETAACHSEETINLRVVPPPSIERVIPRWPAQWRASGM